MIPTHQEIEAVWSEFGITPTGSDMSNECRLAAAIITLRVKLNPVVEGTTSNVIEVLSAPSRLESLKVIRFYGQLSLKLAHTVVTQTPSLFQVVYPDSTKESVASCLKELRDLNCSAQEKPC